MSALLFAACMCADGTHRNPDRLPWADTLAQAKRDAHPAWMAGAMAHYIQRETKRVSA